jgi:ribonuclease D
MRIITTTDDLASACADLAQAPFVAVDTEFLRESTYWPILCLVQVAGGDVEAIIDPLAPGLDLAPLLALMSDPNVVKVVHSGRQDIEIFARLMGGATPFPVFDSQIAAMALGYGDSIAYDGLVAAILKRKVDKTSRFTDWSRRPLSEAQLVYALGDVTHLRDMYPKMLDDLSKKGRSAWVEDEMADLIDPAKYDTDPEKAWTRFRPKRMTPDYLATLAVTAAWRERFAQNRDIPRGRVLKDDAVYEIADQRPRDGDAFNRLRAVPKGFAQSKGGAELLAALQAAYANPSAHAPSVERNEPLPNGLGPTVELLKVLLRLDCEAKGVAPKLLATVSELEKLAADDDADVPVLRGWRREVFGNRALALKNGRIGLTMRGKRVKVVDLASAASIED